MFVKSGIKDREYGTNLAKFWRKQAFQLTQCWLLKALTLAAPSILWGHGRRSPRPKWWPRPKIPPPRWGWGRCCVESC